MFGVVIWLHWDHRVTQLEGLELTYPSYRTSHSEFSTLNSEEKSSYQTSHRGYGGSKPSSWVTQWSCCTRITTPNLYISDLERGKIVEYL